MITLRNTQRQRFIFSLYHEFVCRREQSCSCNTSLVPGPGGKLYPRNDPLSVQIDALGVSGPLPDSVFHVPQVRQACASGRLVREMVTQKPKVEVARHAPTPKKTTVKDKE